MDWAISRKLRRLVTQALTTIFRRPFYRTKLHFQKKIEVDSYFSSRINRHILHQDIRTAHKVILPPSHIKSKPVDMDLLLQAAAGQASATCDIMAQPILENVGAQSPNRSSPRKPPTWRTLASPRLDKTDTQEQIAASVAERFGATASMEEYLISAREMCEENHKEYKAAKLISMKVPAGYKK